MLTSSPGLVCILYYKKSDEKRCEETKYKILGEIVLWPENEMLF